MLDLTDRTVTAVLGPTNTGKTHYALERMLARRSGTIGLPLRLLAREVYDRLVQIRGPNAVSLITGEEKICHLHEMAKRGTNPPKRQQQQQQSDSANNNNKRQRYARKPYMYNNGLNGAPFANYPS